MATESLPFPTSAASSGAPDVSGASGYEAGRESTYADPGSRNAVGDAGDGADGGAHRGELLDRVVRTAHSTIDRLADTAAPHVSRLSQTLNEAGERVQDGAGQVREAGDEWAETLRGTVREHPLAALAAALAIGMLVAKLTR